MASNPQIFKATYSGVPVFEMICKNIAVMRRRADAYLNATQILKVAEFDKPQRTRILEREVQKGEHEKVQGGYGKYQGTDREATGQGARGRAGGGERWWDRGKLGKKKRVAKTKGVDHLSQTRLNASWEQTSILWIRYLVATILNPRTIGTIFTLHGLPCIQLRQWTN